MMKECCANCASSKGIVCLLGVPRGRQQHNDAKPEYSNLRPEWHCGRWTSALAAAAQALAKCQGSLDGCQQALAAEREKNAELKIGEWVRKSDYEAAKANAKEWRTKHADLADSADKEIAAEQAALRTAREATAELYNDQAWTDKVVVPDLERQLADATARAEHLQSIRQRLVATIKEKHALLGGANYRADVQTAFAEKVCEDRDAAIDRADAAARMYDDVSEAMKRVQSERDAAEALLTSAGFGPGVPLLEAIGEAIESRDNLRALKRDNHVEIDRLANLETDLNTAIRNWRVATGALSPPDYVRHAEYRWIYWEGVSRRSMLRWMKIDRLQLEQRSVARANAAMVSAFELLAESKAQAKYWKAAHTISEAAATKAEAERAALREQLKGVADELGAMAAGNDWTDAADGIWESLCKAIAIAKGEA